MNIRLTDKGSRKSVEAVFGKRDSSVSVGVLESGKANDTEHDSGITVGELAAIHEFGLGVPERSFIRSYFDVEGGNLSTMLLQLMKQAVHRAIRTGDPITDQVKARILGTIGAVAVGGIQKRIADGEIVPPLDPKTIARKGSNVPLIDTGQLRSSITFKVDL